MFEYPARRNFVVYIAIGVIVLGATLGLFCGKPARPEASFTVTPAADSVLLTRTPIGALPPLTVQFTDRSSGKITSWRWVFGDGGKSTLRNPTHTYTSPGRYNVTLTVQGPGGKHTSKEYVVTVLLCSEAANSELLQARQAIEDCLKAAGQSNLDSAVAAWNGSRGMVTAGNGTKDAADYLADWKAFRATYEVSQHGKIISGTDVSWGCIVWRDDTVPPRWRDPTEI